MEKLRKLAGLEDLIVEDGYVLRGVKDIGFGREASIPYRYFKKYGWVKCSGDYKVSYATKLLKEDKLRFY